MGGVWTIQKCFLDGNIKCHLFQSSSCVENIRKMKLVLDLKLINFNDSFKENPYKQYEYKKFFQESWIVESSSTSRFSPQRSDSYPNIWEQTRGRFCPSFTRLSQKHWNITNFTKIKFWFIQSILSNLSVHGSLMR